MAKSNIPEIVVAGDELDELISSYLDEKAKKEEAEKNMLFILRIFEKMAGHEDPEEPVEEGSIDIKGGEKSVRLKFKMTKSIDKDMAFKLCDEAQYDPRDVFNMKPEYPTQKILDRMNYWNEEDRNKAMEIIQAVTTTKRAKTSVEVK